MFLNPSPPDLNRSTRVNRRKMVSLNGIRFLGVCLIFLSGLPGSLWSQERMGHVETGITVEGTGEAKTIPDVVEINLKLNARGELTDDAVVKHKDSRKRTLETFQALKIENLQLEERDLSLRPGNAQEMRMMMWNGSPPAQNKRTPVEVVSTLRARLVQIDKMPTEELMSTIGKLIDAAQDAGVSMGVSDSDMMNMWYYGNVRQQSLVKFIVTNVHEIREKAYELAVKDARRRAERIARLNGIQIGSVLSVDELNSGNAGGQRTPYWYGSSNDDKEDEDKTEIIAETLSGGKIAVRLKVRFGISAGASTSSTTSTPAASVAQQEKSP